MFFHEAEGEGEQGKSTASRRHVEKFVAPPYCTPGLFETVDAVAAGGVFLFAAAAPSDLLGMPGAPSYMDMGIGSVWREGCERLFVLAKDGWNSVRRLKHVIGDFKYQISEKMEYLQGRKYPWHMQLVV